METNRQTLADFVVYMHQPDPQPFYQVLNDIYNTPEFNKHLNQPVLNLIVRLRSLFRVGYLSNTENFFYPYIYQKINQYFDFETCSWQLGFDKPDPQIYLKTLELQHLKPDEVLFIDDSPQNITSAQTLGIKSILFTNNQSLLSSLRSLTFFS